MENLIEILQQFGLSTNGAKAYVTLLKINPATGYELCTQSGIPRSAIYSLLNKLESIGLVISVGDSPKRFIPLQPSLLLDRFNQSHSLRIRELEESLKNINVNDTVSGFWFLNGYNNLISKMKELSKKANDQILICAMKQCIEEIEIELNNAIIKGVDITVLSYGKLKKNIGNTISLEINSDSSNDVSYHRLVFVKDEEISIMGSGEISEKTQSIMTSNQAFIDLATDHINFQIKNVTNHN